MCLVHTICKTRTSGAAAAQATPLTQVQQHSLGEEKQAGVLSRENLNYLGVNHRHVTYRISSNRRLPRINAGPV